MTSGFGDVISGDVISSDIVSGDATSGDVIYGDATSGDVIYGVTRYDVTETGSHEPETGNEREINSRVLPVFPAFSPVFRAFYRKSSRF
jgi:hypothetical protein